MRRRCEPWRPPGTARSLPRMHPRPLHPINEFAPSECAAEKRKRRAADGDSWTYGEKTWPGLPWAPCAAVPTKPSSLPSTVTTTHARQNVRARKRCQEPLPAGRASCGRPAARPESKGINMSVWLADGTPTCLFLSAPAEPPRAKRQRRRRRLRRLPVGLTKLASRRIAFAEHGQERPATARGRWRNAAHWHAAPVNSLGADCRRPLASSPPAPVGHASRASGPVGAFALLMQRSVSHPRWDGCQSTARPQAGATSQMPTGPRALDLPGRLG